MTVDPERSPEEVWLADLSEWGIGFFSGWPMAKGAVLVIKLTRRYGESAELMTKVAHSTRCTTGEWHVGCEFAERLDADAVDQLL